MATAKADSYEMLIDLFRRLLQRHSLPRDWQSGRHSARTLGHTVEFLEAQTCCGQMHYNTGYGAEALPLMRHIGCSGVRRICVPSASCVSMMRDHYPKMADKTEDRGI